MEKGTQNLEVPKKKSKNWVLRVGLGLLLVCILLDGIIYFITPTTTAALVYGFFFHCIFFVGIFALFLTTIGLLLNVQRKRNRIILTPIALLIYLLIIGQFGRLNFLIATPFEKLAKITENESICGYMPIIDECGDKGQCYRDIALIKGNELICKEINCDYLQDFCYRDVAIKKKDLDICNKIKNPYTRSECLAGKRF